MEFTIRILGTSSATEANGRHQSAQIVKRSSHYFLIDCGEGTQARLKKYRINFNKVKAVFISHLHGDHYFGLMGFLSTMSLMGRQNELTIYAPIGLREIIRTNLKYSQATFTYPIEFVATNSSIKEVLFSNKHLRISSFPLKHGIDCTGFLFEEKLKPFKIKFDALPLNCDPQYIKALKRGENPIMEDGTQLTTDRCTFGRPKSFSYAYCSDTTFNPELVHHIKGVDLMYHESTFLEKHQHKAEATNHSTASQAAQIASLVETKGLLLGHFSARYKDTSEFKAEAQAIFLNSHIAQEGLELPITDTSLSS